ncbi:MAG: thermopsin, partial [Thermoplasmata archaeon]|nr:thermopsin [Thermoplasmata archaeon]
MPALAPETARPFISGPINPEGGYSSEPAPLGVADFGINGQDQAYSYSTSTFVGTANLTSLKSNEVGHPTVGSVAFELNTILTFQVGSTVYTYWLQDGFDVDSHSEQVSLIQEYVWNFSTSSASINSNSVAGNGSLVNYGSFDVFVNHAASSLPGNGITLTFPLLLQLRLVSGTSGANTVPWVGYDYNDGFGWVRTDNISFPFAQNAVGVGQFVDGSAYTPNGAYYDSEFIYAGPGGGVGTDTGSNLQITLDRWNGHNLQAVPNAYNHGGNTGEKIENLSLSATTGLGTPGVSLRDGSGTLGLLYSSTQTGTVTVTAPWSAGTVGVNGAPINFTG